jgi:hypothetical protein
MFPAAAGLTNSEIMAISAELRWAAVEGLAEGCSTLSTGRASAPAGW